MANRLWAISGSAKRSSRSSLVGSHNGTEVEPIGDFETDVFAHRQNHLPSNIEIFEAKSFTINPTGYILELGISFGILAFSGLNFVQIRHCNGGMSP